MSEIIANLIKRLVLKPEEVEVIENQGEQTCVFEVKVAKEDMGRVIGKKGRVIEALRTIVSAFGVKKRKRCLLQLIEEDKD
ncbi:MAG: KH domain-containing protein [Bdellovibrionales bacterium]|nr:KH domain-containing protein [Bdellovibrionales bacterium]